MAEAWTSYQGAVNVVCRNVDRGIAVDRIRAAAIELAEKSTLLRETLPAIDSVVDQRLYTLTPSNSETRISSIIKIRYDGSTLRAKTEDELDQIAPSWEQGEVALRYMSSATDPGELRLLWDPTEAITGAIIARIAYKPTLTSTTGDDILYHEYRDVIAAGAIARLLEMPDQEWSALRRVGNRMHRLVDSQTYWDRFYAGVNDAQFRAQGSNQRVGRSVTMRPFAMGARR